ncbi:MAG: cohesin domain-containing protein [Halobacteriota archaeon]
MLVMIKSGQWRYIRGWCSMDLDWSYNASVLKIINVTKGSVNEKALFDWNEVSAGKLKIAFALSKGVTGSKNSIAIMKFNIIGNPGGHCRIFQ